MKRKLYLVLGLNRSGTSVLSRSLAASGVTFDFSDPALAARLWKTDQFHPDGGYESLEIPAILDLVRQIAARASGGQGNPAISDETFLTVADTIAVAGLLQMIPRFPFAIKDPLLTFQFRQWKEVARHCAAEIDTRPVVSMRHPADQAQALLKRGFCRTLRSGLDQWLRYYTEVQHLFDTGEDPLVIVYDGRQSSFLLQMKRLCEQLDLRFDRKALASVFRPAAPRRRTAAAASILREHTLGRTIGEMFEHLRSRSLAAR